MKDSSTYYLVISRSIEESLISSRVKDGPLSFKLHIHQMHFISLSSKYGGTLIHLQNIIICSQLQLIFSCDGKTRNY